MSSNISLFTDVWGTYFRQILSPGWISQIAQNCGCEFRSIHVCQNNIPEENLEEYCVAISARLDDGSVESFLKIDNCAKHLLIPYGLKPSDFDPLPYQSLADLCAIHRCDTEFMVFFAGDAVPWGKSNWVHEGIELLVRNPEIMIVNPMWNGFESHARSEHQAETDRFFVGQGFSDQCYLARAADLRKDIYHETNEVSDRRYCKEHGNTFEKRVDAWMRNHNKFRATLKTAYYLTRP